MSKPESARDSTKQLQAYAFNVWSYKQGEIVRAKHLMHGKTDKIHHDGKGLFRDLPNPFVATRYHSLVIKPDTLSDEFKLSAWCNEPDGTREVMGIRHKDYPLIGWQFHPESFLTEVGPELLDRFLQLRWPI